MYHQRNRQIHALEGSIKAKVNELALRIHHINPDCTVYAYGIFTSQTADSILSGGFDYLIDAIDGLTNKCLLIDECRMRKIPIITCGAADDRRDGTAVRVTDLEPSTTNFSSKCAAIEAETRLPSWNQEMAAPLRLLRRACAISPARRHRLRK